MSDIGLKFYAVPSAPPPRPHHPHPRPHPHMINEMSISHKSVIKKLSSFKYKNLGESASKQVYSICFMFGMTIDAGPKFYVVRIQTQIFM